MKRINFTKKLVFFMVPLLIPILISGVLSTVITGPFLRKEIEKNNFNVLKQIKDNIELEFNELDSLSLHFNANPEISLGLKELLKTPELSFDKEIFLNNLKYLINAPANARPYIQSIYVYFDNNMRRFITTTVGITSLDTFYDKSWYTSFLNQKDNDLQIFTEVRQVQQYNFEKDLNKQITIYRKLYTRRVDKADGVIVLNIRSSYIESMLKGLVTYPDQSIMIIDKNNNIVSSNKSFVSISNNNISNISLTNKMSFETVLNGKAYEVSQIISDRYGFKYISIVPSSILYQITEKIKIITLILLSLSFIFGVSLTYYFTKKDYARIHNIFSIIDSAEKNLPLPPLQSLIKDEYDYIIHNILKTFIEKNYLNVQLSERKSRLELMELIALQSQINPHFLLNTLETMNWKAYQLTGSRNAVNKILESLSDILKYSLYNINKIMTIEEEIINTKSYIEIQMVRYKDKFDVIWEIGDDVGKQRIVKLVLQPLIENSIYHGIKFKEKKSLIKIKLNQVGDCIRITVVDNGLGIPREKLRHIRFILKEEGDYSESIGLFNTNKRLKLTYGHNYGIEINSKYGVGTAVYICIPVSFSDGSDCNIPPQKLLGGKPPTAEG